MSRTRLIGVDRDRPSPASIAEAARVLRAGGLVAFATETVYGLGADATNPNAVARIFEAKGRPATNPLIVHVEGKASALDCVSRWPRRAEILSERFWPGPLTLVLPRSPLIPDIVTAGEDTVGVRVPALGVARWLILETGRPIAAPSANRSMGVSPTLAEHVVRDLDGQVDLILDSGPTMIGIESTVLDLSTDVPRILRPGEITREQIAEAIGEAVGLPEPSGPIRSPGQMAVHYAPRTPTYRLDRDKFPTQLVDGKKYRLLILGPISDRWRDWLKPVEGSNSRHLVLPEDAAGLLYARLRNLDDLDLDYILIMPPPDEPQWQAIRDRVWRATKPWPPER